MTDVGRMSVAELVGKVLADEHADGLRQAVCWLAEELMEAEVSQRAGAGYGERNPERAARRNGYREWSRRPTSTGSRPPRWIGWWRPGAGWGVQGHRFAALPGLG